MEYGIQMYSVRDTAEKNLKDALAKVSEMGYKYIEFAGFFGNSAESVKSWLDEYGLIASGTHTNIAAIAEDKLLETVNYHKAIGCKNLIVPGADWGSEESMDENIRIMNAANPALREAGITLSYHNHSGEFYKTAYGKLIEEEILARTDVKLEIDTFWLFNAGVDVIPYLNSHKERISLVHLKDGYPTTEENPDIKSCHKGVIGKSLGLGKAPVLAVREWAVENGVPMVVESEGLEPTGMEEVKRCIDFLRSLEK